MHLPNSAASQTAAIIGGGPAGLMAAEVLSNAGIQVHVYDAMPSLGRKFLMAGKGGMNISHSEALGQFLQRYGNSETVMAPMLKAFGPNELLSWLQDLGISTFVGSSGRIFPTDMKAAPLLRAWLHRLRGNGVKFHVRHLWQGWVGECDKTLRFRSDTGERLLTADVVVLALGGGSWPQLGSTGAWLPLLKQRGVATAELLPSNCGFECRWRDDFGRRFAGTPIKPVKISYTDRQGQHFVRQGELIITEQGLEGGLLYALTPPLRQEILATGQVVIYLDLAPDQTAVSLMSKLTAARGKQSLSNHLRKRAGISGVKAGLLREILTLDTLADMQKLSSVVKALPIALTGLRPLSEAISSAGGVCFSAVNAQLMLNQLPGVFVAGEMLNWEAPTGGYLLTGCFATGRTAGLGALAWLKSHATCFGTSPA